MTDHLRINKLLEDVMRGKEPERVVQAYLEGINEFTQKEHDVVEGLLAFYPDLAAEDATKFDDVMNRYYEDDAYPLAIALRDLVNSDISEFMTERITSLVDRHNFKIEGGYDLL